MTALTLAVLGLLAAAALAILWHTGFFATIYITAYNIQQHRRNRKDIRAAFKQLDVRNGWIVERGRNKHFAVIHCGKCPNRVRIFNSLSKPEALEQGIEFATSRRCAHKIQDQEATDAPD